MSFKSNLNEILNDLNCHRRNREELLPFYIQTRLNQSLETYYKELSDSLNYLSNKDELKTLRKMNKYEE